MLLQVRIAFVTAVLTLVYVHWGSLVLVAAGYGSLTVFPYGNNASVSIVGCLLIGNTGGNDLIAVDYIEWKVLSLRLRAGFGGGLYLGASGADSVVSIESCTFAGNHAGVFKFLIPPDVQCLCYDDVFFETHLVMSRIMSFA